MLTLDTTTKSWMSKAVEVPKPSWTIPHQNKERIAVQPIKRIEKEKAVQTFKNQFEGTKRYSETSDRPRNRTRY